ncbi:MAG: TonB-dependent receptor [Myxococcota bacterium]
MKSNGLRAAFSMGLTLSLYVCARSHAWAQADIDETGPTPGDHASLSELPSEPTANDGIQGEMDDAALPELDGGAENDLLALSFESFEELMAVELVQSASRRTQSIHEAPSAITLLTSNQIEALGAQYVPEILRRVVGVHVIRPSANFFRVTMRNPGALANGRIRVLLDGRSVMDPLANLNSMSGIAVTPGQVERIEVIRGPGSTLYGPNAVGGVISIRSRRPLDHPGFEGRFQGGVGYLPQEEITSASLQDVGMGYLGYNWVNSDRTIGAQLSMGYGQMRDWSEDLEIDEDGHYFNFRPSFQYRPDERTEIWIGGVIKRMELVAALGGIGAPTELEEVEHAVIVSASRNGMVDGLVSALVQFDSTYRQNTIFGITPDGFEHHLLVQSDLSLFGGRSVTLVGGEMNLMRFNDFSSVDPESTDLSIFLQEELALTSDRRFLVNTAIRFDRTQYSDGQGVKATYRNANPRATLIYRPHRDHDVRLSFATAFRVPRALQISTGIVRPPTNPEDPAIRILVANPSIKPESMRSMEVGYRGNLGETLRVDFTGFVQELENILETDEDEVGGVLPLAYVNGDTIQTLGGELAVSWTPDPMFSTYLNYRSARSRREASGDRYRRMPEHVLGYGFDIRPGLGFSIHTDLNFVTGVTARKSLGELQDLSTPASEDSLPDIIDLNLKVAKSIFGGRAEVFMNGRNLAALFRDESELVVGGFSGQALPIGATVLAGIRFSEE